MRGCQKGFSCYNSETAEPIEFKFGTWVVAAKLTFMNRSVPGAFINYVTKFELGNGWTDCVQIWYMASGCQDDIYEYVISGAVHKLRNRVVANKYRMWVSLARSSPTEAFYWYSVISCKTMLTAPGHRRSNSS